MQSLFLLFTCIYFTNGYETCGDINIYSFGNALNEDFLGQYTQQDAITKKRHVFGIISSDKEYKLWWSYFRNQISRWSIGHIVGDESSVIAYKDSHALHPSEIARQRSLWRVYDRDSGKWRVDQSIHVKCNDVISAFEWKQDCLVLGVTNVDAMDTLDYLKISGHGLTAKYHSTSTGFDIEHDGSHWNIMNRYRSIKASIKSENIFPNGINKDETKWILSKNKISESMSVHCEVPGKPYYYQGLREKFAVCTGNSVADNFKNVHFDTVVIKDVDEWNFGITDDLKYFMWNETNGLCHKIPSVGIGTAGINNDEEVIKWAVNDYFYELIDSASDHAPWYQNEYIIGYLLNNNILKRETFLLTTKLYAKDQGLSGAKHGLDDSLSALNVDYIDIYLIHHPFCDNKLGCDGTWKTSWRIIEDYYFKNKIKYVGVSNFDINQFHELLDWSNIPISVVQNWFDPFRQNDRNILKECNKLSIIYFAYSLLGNQWKYIGNGYNGNKDPVFTNSELNKIAQKYNNKSIAQIVLRWAIQNKIGVLPSSSNQHRIKENINIFDFKLNQEDVIAIDNIK